ncbi:MAG TPA: DUF1572 family protein, partial [Puia sp.]
MSTTLGSAFLESAIKRVATYKLLGDYTFRQLEEKDFYFSPNEQSNSLAVIIKHLSGNMISRWTNFLTEDGEKSGRNRETEFTLDEHYTRDQLLEQWEMGWDCFLGTLRSLTEDDLLRTIYIRHEPLLAIDAINRQLAHYPHHIGQIVYLGKMIKGKDWQSLSIPKGGSEQFNRLMKEQH